VLQQRSSNADQFDAIVVGARCAGSPLATLLSRAGFEVCLVDRADFPSDTPSTHGIQPCGVKVLERLGVRDAVEATTEPVENALLAFDEHRVELSEFDRKVGAPMLNVRRVTLDAILLEAAAAAGVEVRTGTSVTGLVESEGRVGGVETTAGTLRSPLVVGADGARSTVAGLVGAAEYMQTPARRIFTWAYYEGVPGEGKVWLGRVGEHAYLASPTDAGLYLAAVVPPIERWEELRADRERHYDEGLAAWPELREHLGGAKRVGPVRMMSRWHGFFRESAGPGWALVGDAGHFKDPTPGQGIADALRQVVELAGAIEKGLGGGDPDRALSEWWSWRDRDAWEMYWFAQEMALPGRLPQLSSVVDERFAAEPEQVEGLLHVLNHDIPPSELFGPGFAASTLAKAFVRRRGRRRDLLGEVRTLAGEQIRRRKPPALPNR
jgi:2-polyprenyl-6-methoxyphenol hydroxylase-like FAD-dependent oxidoreductase